jgi:hypothetical protein
LTGICAVFSTTGSLYKCAETVSHAGRHFLFNKRNITNNMTLCSTTLHPTTRCVFRSVGTPRNDDGGFTVENFVFSSVSIPTLWFLLSTSRGWFIQSRRDCRIERAFEVGTFDL